MSNSTVIKLNEGLKSNFKVQARPTPLYSIIVISSGGLNDGLSKDSGQLSFVFDMPPSSISVDEPSAMTVTPTQGGVFTEGQGQLIKSISIEGTTGYRPNAVTSSNSGGLFNWRTALQGLTNTVPALVDNRGLPQGEKTTGFEDFIRLRNIFRSYWEAKQDDSRASSTFMIWGNLKEHEVYIVEPMSFQTRRDRGFLFRYNISFKTIACLNEVVSFPPDPLEDYVTAPNQSIISKYLNYVHKADRFLTNAMNGLTLIMESAAGQSQDAIRSSMRLVSNYEESCKRLVNASQRTVDFFSYDGLRTFFEDMKYTRSIFQGGTTTTQSYLKTHTLKRAYQATEHGAALLQKAATGTTLDTKMQDLGDKYNKRTEWSEFTEPFDENLKLNALMYPKTQARFGDSGTNMMPGSKIFGEGVGVDYVRGRETIRDAAYRLLKDRGQWRALAVFNNLKFPYFADDGNGIDVLTPGDKIYYPMELNRNVRSNNMVTSFDRDIETQMGTDIYLDSTTDDLVLSPSGDMEVVSGLANLKQALRIKFSTEPGELALHPWFGGAVSVGERITGLSALAAHALSARMTVLSDPRISDINSLDIEQEGDVIRFRIEMGVSGMNTTVSLSHFVGRSG